MTIPCHAIEAVDLHFRYPDGTAALRGLTLRIGKGEKVCLAGPNGAGKSTLLSCLAGLTQAQGLLKVVGRDPLPDPSVFGLVFQNPDDQLFCPTVGEDIAFGPRNQKKPASALPSLVERSLAAVGLSGFEGRSAHHLSGGEKKRAAIAAVLACTPPILALDEPWANLDLRAARAVSKILESYEGTLLVASHDLRRAATLCSRLIVIEGGTVVLDTSMQEATSIPDTLEAYGIELR